jgi:UDP-2-acetamido-2,6-beta-L-arabino-hexul-4-ose reductase
MLRIGITGQAGFIGTHLYNYLKIRNEEVVVIPFRDDFFEQQSKLERFVNDCDTIVHLAALNRHNETQTIYDTNVKLVSQLIEALENTDNKPHILFSSSTQEERDNVFGKSKLEGRRLFSEWAACVRTVWESLL